MFFCEPCRVEKKWPKSLGFPFMGVSYGFCEICGKTADCHDVPSSALPIRFTGEKVYTVTTTQEFAPVGQQAIQLELAQISDEELATEVKRRKEAAKLPPPVLENPDFSTVIATAKSIAADAGVNNYDAEDSSRYLLEAVMEAVYGKDVFWKWWNNLPCNK